MLTPLISVASGRWDRSLHEEALPWFLQCALVPTVARQVSLLKLACTDTHASAMKARSARLAEVLGTSSSAHAAVAHAGIEAGTSDHSHAGPSPAASSITIPVASSNMVRPFGRRGGTTAAAAAIVASLLLLLLLAPKLLHVAHLHDNLTPQVSSVPMDCNHNNRVAVKSDSSAALLCTIAALPYHGSSRVLQSAVLTDHVPVLGTITIDE